MKLLDLFKTKENIFKGGIVLFFAMTLVNFGNYLFNMIMGRMLGPADYGALVSLLAFLAIISVPAATLQTSAMKFSSVFRAKQQDGKINYLLRYITKKTVFISIIVCLLLILFSYYISKFLNLGSATPVIILASSCLFFFLLPFNRGIIQGIQNFTGLSINIGLEPIIKIFLGILLVYFGLKLNGSLLAILLSSFLVYLLSFYFLKKILKQPIESFATRSFWRYSFTTLCAIFLLSFLTYIDVIAVKHYFSPEDAGLYSALSTVSKIVLYFSMPFIATMFPKISRLHVKKEKHFSVLAQTFIVTSLLSIAVMVFFMILPEFSIKILFGQQYLAVSPYLGRLSFAMFLLVLINVFVNYFLAISKSYSVIPLLIFSLSEVLCLVWFHSNFNQIINVLIINFSGLLVMLGIFYIYIKKEQIFHVIGNYTRV